MAEYFAVSEEKLKALPIETVKDLLDNGAMAQIYAHLMSLGGWDRLITLTMARNAEAQAAAASVN